MRMLLKKQSFLHLIIPEKLYQWEKTISEHFVCKYILIQIKIYRTVKKNK